MSALIPQQAPQGSEVTLQGQVVGVQPVMDIRWNGLSGPKVGEARVMAGSFSASISVPDVSPGVYTLVGVSGDRAVVRAPFEVTGQDLAVSTVEPSAWAGSSVRPQPALAPSGSSGLLPGAALLSVGLVALFTSVTVVSVRRRRATVRSPLS